MKTDRFFPSVVLLIAFAIPIIAGLARTEVLDCVLGFAPLAAVYLWLTIYFSDNDSYEHDLLRTSVFALIFGIIVAILVTVSGNSDVLWLTLAMGVSTICVFHYL